MDEATFNVCSRCGSANPLSAKYCYQCGFELKAPETPVVCAKCHAVNPGSANFCKRCGSQLSSAHAKIICPKCSTANSLTSAHCVNCGYDFSAHALPSSLQIGAAAQDNSHKSKSQLKKEEKARARAEKEQKKNGTAPVIQAQYVKPYAQQPEVTQVASSGKTVARVKSVIMFVIALVALYFVLLPPQVSLGMSFPLVTAGGFALGGWDAMIAALTPLSADIAKLSPVVDAAVFGAFDMRLAMTALAIAAAAVFLLYYVIVKLVCIISGRRRYEFDWLGLLLTLAYLAAAIASSCTATPEFSTTWQTYIVPLAFLLITIFNFGRMQNKQRKV